MINYGKLIDFTTDNYNSDGLSDIMQSTLENYFCHGLEPGGFTTAVLEGNLFAAAQRADHWNKENLAKIANWVFQNAPGGSYGSKEAVRDWLTDKDYRRTVYHDEMEKKYIWNELNKA
jgi:hypothetical protein